MLRMGDRAPAFRVEPVFGRPVSVPDEERPMFVVFARYLGSALTRRNLLALQGRVQDFDRAGVGIVAITDSGPTAAQDFVPRHHVLFPLACDPSGALRRLYGVRAPFSGMLLASPLALRRFLASLRHGHGLVDGPLRSGFAAFVVAPDGALLWAEAPRDVTRPLDLESALRAAQVDSAPS